MVVLENFLSTEEENEIVESVGSNYNNIGLVVIPESVFIIEPFAFSNNTIFDVIILGDMYRFNDNWTVIGFPMYLMPLPV